MNNVKFFDIPDRFSNKVDTSSGECWLWTASKNSKGYGSYKLNGNLVLAHRYSWEFFNGTIPKGIFVLHKCDVRNCVNPKHLFIGTNRDNAIDMINKGRGYTPRGEKHGMSQLTQVHVDEIRKSYQRYTKGTFSQGWLAQKYGVSQQTVSRIVNNKAWKIQSEQVSTC